ncbi:MAG TPA: GNAT family protein [Kofleriaceae bacterium]|jgi:RimJ/RimL family protein N-acetyltransferase
MSVVPGLQRNASANLSARAPTLTTERLVLRELRLDDAGAIAAGAGDRRVARYLLAVPSPYPVALARRWLVGRIEWWREGRGVTFAIARKNQPNTLLGTVSLRRYTRDQRAELGYWLATSAWNHGFATEACTAAIDFGFRELSLARIYAQVLGDNRGSHRVVTKLGFVTEGVKRQHVRRDTELCDLVLYGLLRDEWAASTD